jgi:hypothetical protein
MRFLLIILSCILYTGCASSVSQKNALPWSTFAQKAGISREEAEAIASAAVKSRNLTVTGMAKEKDDEIAVSLGKSRTAKGGLVVFFKKTASGWVENTDSFSTWSQK